MVNCDVSEVCDQKNIRWFASILLYVSSFYQAHFALSSGGKSSFDYIGDIRFDARMLKGGR
jgi:hypothetical protein